MAGTALAEISLVESLRQMLSCGVIWETREKELPFETRCSSDWTQSCAKLQPRALERVFPTRDYGARARDPRAGAGTQIENTNEHQ